MRSKILLFFSPVVPLFFFGLFFTSKSVFVDGINGENVDQLMTYLIALPSIAIAFLLKHIFRHKKTAS